MSTTNEKLSELLENAIEKLNIQLKFYKDKGTENAKVLQTFKLDNLLSEIPIELFEKNDVCDHDHMRQPQSIRLNKKFKELYISTLDKHINVYQSMNKSLENNIDFMKKGLLKYEEEEYFKSDVEHDIVDISGLQATTEKLQADIHQANYEQEPKKEVMDKLKRCYEMKREIDESISEREKIKQSLQYYASLPPDIDEAENKLNELQRKYRELSIKFNEMSVTSL